MIVLCPAASLVFERSVCRWRRAPRHWHRRPSSPGFRHRAPVLWRLQAHSSWRIAAAILVLQLQHGEKQASLDAGKGDKGVAPSVSPVQKALGMEFGALSAESRKKFSLKDGAEGVLVTSVDPDSQAAEKRISAGDRILEINQDAVSKPEDVARKLKELKDQGRKSALLFVASPQDDKRFVPLSLN